MCPGRPLRGHFVDGDSRGKGEDEKKEFSELGGTAACTIRGVKATREFKDLPVDNFSFDEPKRCICGDCWFG